MTLRLINLPTDLQPLGQLIVESIHYPENPDWSVQTDEKEDLVAAIKRLRRVWPLIRLVQAFSPPLRDILRGYVWEEDDRIVGTTIVQRRGATAVWAVGTVAVLPDYRRRGLARKMVTAGLDLIREHGGEKVILTVIDGNLPAYQLYERLGFEHYSGSTDFQTAPATVPPSPTLPQGYVQSPLSTFDWQPRYALEERISPENMLKYEPIEVNRFRQPFMMRLLLPLIRFAQSTREKEFVLRTTADDKVVARGGYSISTRGKGVNRIWARLDPAHPQLAPYLIGYALHQTVTQSPRLRVELSVPWWMKSLASAAQEAGFERRVEYCRMGLEF